MYFLISIVLVTYSSTVVGGSYRKCFQCEGVNTTTDCHNITTCADQEQCHVRKYISNQAEIKFDMECMSDGFCSQVHPGHHRRSGNGMIVWNRCCDHDLCNFNYDQNGADLACPEGFIRWHNHNSCYLFEIHNETQWDDATKLCEGHKAQIVSINTQEENDFLVQHLDKVHPRADVMAIWLGTEWSPQKHDYVWLDQTSLTIDHFKSDTLSLRKMDHYNIVMRNPDFHRNRTRWDWDTDPHYYHRGVICEKHSVQSLHPVNLNNVHDQI